MTELLSTSYPVTMTQNVIYALPARRCLLFSQSGGTILQSNTVGFSVSKALTLDTNNQAEVCGGFIECTSGDIIVTLKHI